MRTYSTKEAAKRAGIHWVTLHRWLADKKARPNIQPSIGVRTNGSTLWRWTAADVERVLKYKAMNYRKGRGRKPAKKRISK